MKARNSSTTLAKTGLSLRTAAVWPWTRAASWGTSRSGLMSVWKTFPVRALMNDFDRADFQHPVSLRGIEACRFGVEHDFTHGRPQSPVSAAAARMN